MKKNVYAIILLCFWGFSTLQGQDKLIESLNNNYSKYELISVDTEVLYAQLEEKNTFHNISLPIGDSKYDLELWDSRLFSSDYKVTLASGSKHEGTRPLALKGNIKGDASSEVRLTINKGFVYGFIKHGGKTLNIQPARYDDKSAGSDLMVTYYSADYKDKEHRTCGNTSRDKLKNQIQDNVNNNLNRSVGDCYEVLISLAADWLMFDAYGGTSGAEDQIVGVLNDVETSYDDEFADEIIYDLNDIFISDCSTCDPWTSSTSADDLLDDFAAWAPNNLGSHEVATLWTDRNLDGSTIGLAWLGTACTNFGYNVCQDINGAQVLRVLQSHELGHNFDAVHDGGGGFIMSPSVSGSTVWTQNSEDDILNFFMNAPCFTSCGTGGFAPIADFDYDVLSECTPGEVEFFADSDDATDWFWTFEGGFPETSTDEDPIVYYDVPGIYSVTLEVSNNLGSDTQFEEDLIEISETPIAAFDYELDELELILDNQSTGNDLDYIWEFGDGEYSTEEEPGHFYDAPGTYVIELDIENDCGFEVIEEEIEVYDEPSALFSSLTETACVNSEFQFNDISYGNIEDRYWSFPGGSPSNSTDENPIVVYDTPGEYDVTLEVFNPEGGDIITEISYVTILDASTSAFTYSAVNTNVSFSNTSNNATSYSWNFGDGSSSTDENPVHNYAASGFYTVILNSSNDCGSNVSEQTIAVYDQPNALFSSTTPTGCANSTVQFNDISTGNIVEYNWTFPGGTPSSSTDINPVVIYSTPGVYDATLRVTNPSGESTTTELSYVNITPAPTASFSYAAANTTVIFTNTSLNPTTYSWNFGDGNSSTDASPTHNYGTVGSYNVSCTASNACGSTTVTQTITVNLAPGAQFSTSQQPSGCATHTIDFIDISSGNPTSWNWSFPGGSPSTSNMQNPTVSYSTPGTFDVTLIAGNAEGSNEQIRSDFVQISGPPSASYTSNVDGNRLDLTNTTPGSTAEWTISDGSTFNGNSIVHILETNGTYTVTLKVTGDCGIDEVDFVIEVDAYPTSSFSSINTLMSDCAPQVVEFSSTSVNATSYSWQFPGGTPVSSTEENPSVSYNTIGIYDVILEVSNQFGTDLSAKFGIITVQDVPTANFSSTANGQTTNFSNSSTNGTNYSWDFGDGNTSNLENPSHNYDVSGTYIVSLIVTNECGSSEYDQTVIFDYSLPIINALFSTMSGCAPLEVEIMDQTTNEPISWMWEMPGGTPATSTEQNPTVNYSQPGIYTISAEVTNSDGSSSFEFTDIIVVQDMPVSDFEITSDDESISTVNNSIGAESYSWDFGDGQTSTDFEPEHNYAESGDYNVTLSVTNECGTVEFTQMINIDISTSTADVQTFGLWTISPNPSDGEVNISFENPISENINFQINDIQGRIIKKGLLTSGTELETLTIQEAGVFVLLLQNENKIDVKKLIIID